MVKETKESGQATNLLCDRPTDMLLLSAVGSVCLLRHAVLFVFLSFSFDQHRLIDRSMGRSMGRFIESCLFFLYTPQRLVGCCCCSRREAVDMGEPLREMGRPFAAWLVATVVTIEVHLGGHCFVRTQTIHRTIWVPFGSIATFGPLSAVDSVDLIIRLE